MSDVRYLSKKFILEFIDLYKSLPSLWNLKSKEYYDRSKKNADYEIMVQKLREVEPEATREMVTQKINSMRGSRRKEMAKIKQSIEAGREVYVPKLWYYKLMDFVYDQETREWEEKASENAPSPVSQVDTDTDSVTIVSRRPSISSSNSAPNLKSEPEDTSAVAFPTQTSKRQIKRKRKQPRKEKAVDTDTGSVTIVSRRPSISSSNSAPNLKSEPEDTSAVAFPTQTSKRQIKRKRKQPRKEKAVSHEAFGRYVAHKLENLPSSQRIFVEKIISDAIFEAELGNLSRNCYIHVPAPSDTD